MLRKGIYEKYHSTECSISRAVRRGKFILKTGIFRKYPSRTCYICLITPNVNFQKRIDDRDVTSRIESFFGKYHGKEGKKGISVLHIPRYLFDNSKLVKNTLATNQSKLRILT